MYTLNFQYACLSRCNLSGANLSYCCLERADLSHANLEGSQLLGVKALCANMEGNFIYIKHKLCVYRKIIAAHNLHYSDFEIIFYKINYSIFLLSFNVSILYYILINPL